MAQTQRRILVDQVDQQSDAQNPVQAVVSSYDQNEPELQVPKEISAYKTVQKAGYRICPVEYDRNQNAVKIYDEVREITIKFKRDQRELPDEYAIVQAKAKETDREFTAVLFFRKENLWGAYEVTLSGWSHKIDPRRTDVLPPSGSEASKIEEAQIVKGWSIHQLTQG